MKLNDRKIENIIEQNIKVNNADLTDALSRDKLRIQDLYTLAMDHSEKIAVSTEDIFQAREKTREAWGSIFPQLSFRANLNLPVTSSTGGIFNQGFRFYARQNILTGWNEISAIRAGTLLEDYSTYQLKSQAANLYDQIAQIFFEYLLLEDSLNTQQILLENSTNLKNELEKRFYLGKNRRSEILSVDVIISKTSAQIVHSGVLLSEAQKKIRSLTGLDRDFVPDKKEDENKFNPDKYMDSYFDQPGNIDKRPDIMALKSEWELAKINSTNMLGNHLPTVYLEGQYRLPDAASSLQSGVPDYYGGIVVQFPLFSGGTTHSRFLAAKSRERQAELRYKELHRTAGDELNFYIHSWQAGEKQLEMLKQAKEKAEGAYIAMLQDYRVGQATNLEVLSALNNQVSARDEFEKARLNQKLLVIHIKIITGELP